MQRRRKKLSFFIHDINEKPTIPLKSKSTPLSYGRASRSKLFYCIRANFARALRFISTRRRRSSSRRTEGPSSNATPLQFAAPARDSHHSEAIEDCIEFINSSYKKPLESSA